MDTPTAAAITGWSLVDFRSLGYETDEKLQVVVGRSVQWLEWATGRKFDSTLAVNLSLMAEEATQIHVELRALQSQSDAVESIQDIDSISSMSVGDYSETRRKLGEQKNSGMIHPHPRLNELLWALCTVARAEEWTAETTGIPAPAAIMRPINWNSPYRDLYSHGW